MIQYEIINTPEYCGKIIVQKRGTKTPAHKHKRKHETFLVWSGSVRMTVDGSLYQLDPGNVISIERGSLHKFAAPDTDSVLLEISTCSSPRDSYFAEKGMWKQVNRRENETTTYPWPFNLQCNSERSSAWGSR
jgi:N-acetylneuraminate synthase